MLSGHQYVLAPMFRMTCVAGYDLHEEDLRL